MLVDGLRSVPPFVVLESIITRIWNEGQEKTNAIHGMAIDYFQFQIENETKIQYNAGWNVIFRGDEMLHIAICDDEMDFVAYLTGLLDQYATETGVEIKVTAYYDGMELIEKYDTTIDLIFLDIQMRLVNGLRAAERVRQMDEKVGIIFLTTLTQYGLEGYKYQATNYIIKPIRYARLKEEMKQWLERHRQDDSPFIVVANDAGKFKVFLKSLRFIETFNRNLLLHTDQENIICYKKMKELETELVQHGFVRCHSGYLVNLFYVKRIEKLDIILTTGERVPISQPKRKEFMERLADYWGDWL